MTGEWSPQSVTKIIVRDGPRLVVPSNSRSKQEGGVAVVIYTGNPLLGLLFTQPVFGRKEGGLLCVIGSSLVTVMCDTHHDCDSYPPTPHS